jgi:hypothetical protein
MDALAANLAMREPLLPPFIFAWTPLLFLTLIGTFCWS